MKRLTFLFFLFSFQNLVAQNNYLEDSVKIAGFKKKVILLINPKPDSALFYINKSFEVVKKSNYQRGLADTEYLLAQYFKRTQQIDSALFYFETSAKRSEKENYSTGAAIAYNGLCRNLYLLARYEEAESACTKALENIKSERELDYMTRADTYTALGTIYSRQDLVEKALLNFLRVDSMHFLRPLRADVIAAAYQNLGGIYLEFDDIPLAESYYLKANREFEKLPPNAAEYYISSNNVELGKLFIKMKELDKADSILTNSHSFFKKIQDLPTASEIGTTLAQIKLEKKQFDSAEDLLAESFEFYKQSSFKLEAANNAIELARLSLTQQNPQKALLWSQRATLLNESAKNSNSEKDLAFVLAATYAQMGDYKKANEWNEVGYRIKDSLEQIQSAERIREIEGKYQTTQRDEEITLLKAQNELAEQQKQSQRNLLLGGIGITSLGLLSFFILYRNRQKTNDRLLELDKLKTNFFTNVSHEFRTPLTLISSPIQEILAEPDLPSHTRSHFEMAERNTVRLLSLVDQLLELSKIDSGNRKLQLEKDRPTHLIAAWAESFSYLAQQKNIDLEIQVENKDEQAWFDKDAMEKIVANLLGNAVKYTPENGSIRVSTSIASNILEFKVANTGKGLTKMQTKTIFERFYQTDEQSEGTGIGLSLVKELSELHQGTVAVASDQLQWTTFMVKLCVDKKKFKDAILREAGTSSENGLPSIYEEDPILEKEAMDDESLPILLIVEDNADVLELLSNTFRQSYRIITATNGEEGIYEAIEQIPDLIISDIMMPIKDGVALTKHLKEDERTSHVPIILLTAKAGDENELKGIEVGADDYITKPFNQKILKSKAHSLIALRKKLQSRYSQEIILKPKDIAITSVDERFLEKVQNVLDEKLVDSSFNTETFSEAVHMSRMQLHRKLKALTGLSTSQFVRSQRLKLATQLLKQSDANISQIGYSVGFNDPAYFAKCFKEIYHCTPSEFTNKV